MWSMSRCSAESGIPLVDEAVEDVGHRTRRCAIPTGVVVAERPPRWHRGVAEQVRGRVVSTVSSSPMAT